jgi:DmsE family decaheme c-type cytochrome
MGETPMNDSSMRGNRLILLSIGLLTAAVAAIGLTSSSAAAGMVDNETCLACHDDVGDNYAMTPHGIYFQQRPALRDFGCESCHGAGLRHIEDPTPENILNPARSDQFGSSILCVQCHNGEQFDEWEFSSHHNADLNCASCHTIHAPVGQTMVKPTPDLCYDCHSNVQVAMNMPSRHPVREGKMSCSDCHNPHGGSVSLTMDDSGRELCFSCHADKEGPFVYEHAPVSEDCGYCHVPHGSVANNLLVQNEPTLCLNCHSMHFHATFYSKDGEFAVPQAPERASRSTADGWKRVMLTKCTQCHTTVHGSDLPSQATSTGGNALTR